MTVQRIAGFSTLALALLFSSPSWSDQANLQPALEESMHLYYFGADRRETFDRLEALAHQDCAKAQSKLAGMRNLVPEEERDAHSLTWSLRAAEGGNAESQFFIGLAHIMGWWGLPPFQEKEAEKWFQLAAKQGHPLAMVELGDLGQTLVETYMWRTLAAPRFPPATDDPAYGLGFDNEFREMHRGRTDSITERMSFEEIVEAEKRVAEWEEHHNRIRHMPAESEEPIPFWFDAIEGPCDV